MRYTIVGGGIVGLATAYALLRKQPDAHVTVLEKEQQLGKHQSTHNSGVLHAGLYYKPGSAKARLAVAGINQMVDFAQEHNIPHEVCGKLVVAVDRDEVPRLKELHRRGTENGLRGLRWLTREEAVEVEPNCQAVAALHVPDEGIIDYPLVCAKLAERIRLQDGRVITKAAVHKIQKRNSRWVLETGAGDHICDVLINCAGLQSDRIAALAGERLSTRIVPFRGEYYRLRADRQHLVNNLIYPVPDPTFPFLGVHFTRMINGGVEAGPNAVLSLARECYGRNRINVRDTINSLGFPGLWRFLREHRQMCTAELKRSFSKRLFCTSLQRLVPDLNETDLEPAFAGVRAQAMTRTGQLVQDFLIHRAARALHLLNAPSPGATASLAIGDHLAQQALCA